MLKGARSSPPARVQGILSSDHIGVAFGRELGAGLVVPDVLVQYGVRPQSRHDDVPPVQGETRRNLQKVYTFVVTLLAIFETKVGLGLNFEVFF